MDDEPMQVEEEYSCAQCSGIVKAGDKICPYCGAEFEELPAEDPGKIVVLRIYMNIIDAEFALQHLNTNNIMAYISQDDCGGMDVFLNPVNGVRLMVKQEDLEKAEEVLQSF